MGFRGLPVPVDALPDLFGGVVAGRTLIIDGDGPAYTVAATTKTVPTAVRHFQQRMLELMFMARASVGEVHMTAGTSHKAGRFFIKATKPYQGNREGKQKPPNLEAVRQAVAAQHNILEDYDVVMNHLVEADDAMMMQAYRLKERGVIWSDDKDLRMTPYPYFDKKTGQVVTLDNTLGWTEIGYTDSGTVKPLGHGLKFFWWQMLMGDNADNIKGLQKLDGKLCGAVLAHEYLQGVRTETEAAEAVLSAYRRIDQNPLPEAWLLWLLRWPGDSFWVYLVSLNINQDLLGWVAECSHREWFSTETV